MCFRSTCVLRYLYEPAATTFRFAQKFVDGINLTVRISWANVGSGYCVRDFAHGRTLPRLVIGSPAGIVGENSDFCNNRSHGLLSDVSFAPSGAGDFAASTHGLRRGLHSDAASRLR